MPPKPKVEPVFDRQRILDLIAEQNAKSKPKKGKDDDDDANDDDDSDDDDVPIVKMASQAKTKGRRSARKLKRALLVNSIKKRKLA